MTILSGSWGSGNWGAGPWGGPSSSLGPIQVLSAIAVRENTIRIEFSTAVYWSGILDEEDASRSAKWRIFDVAGTAGLDGEPVRALLVGDVVLPGVTDGIAKKDIGRFVDVISDRPMSPFPCVYEVEVTDVFSSDLSSSVSEKVLVFAAYRNLARPRIDLASPSRDFANAQTLDAARASLPGPEDPLSIGTMRTDDTGDYAFDDGIVNLRKRVLRRFFSKKNGFAHLPGYGLDVMSYGKKLAVPAIVAGIAAEAEAKFSREPDVDKAKVRASFDPKFPSMVRFQVFIRPKFGKAQRVDVPVVFG